MRHQSKTALVIFALATLGAGAWPAASQAADTYSHTSQNGVQCTATLSNRASEDRIRIRLTSNCNQNLVRQGANAALKRPDGTQAVVGSNSCKDCADLSASAVFRKRIQCGQTYEFRGTVRYELASPDKWVTFLPVVGCLPMSGTDNRGLLCTYNQKITPC